MVDHLYDTPGLMPREFLLRVMRDKSVPIRTRIRAAAELLKLFPEDFPHISAEATTTYVIPEFPSIELMKDLQYIKRCYELGINPDLTCVQPQGHG
jgi:hypothetical protein